MAHPHAIRHVDGLAALASDHDLILCDVWGVLHDGVHAHPAASEALIAFRRSRRDRPRRVVLVSNAPRPRDFVRGLLDDLGVARDAYDAILTSGDLTRALIADVLAADPATRVHHLGPDRIAGLFAGLGARLVPAQEASLVVCTALIEDTRESVEDYRRTLAGLRARDVPMICANPDLMVERGGRLTPCAGVLAAAYAEIGGRVVYAGKPHPAIYRAALAAAAALDGEAPSRVLAIGDALHTDIAGARDFGIASLFVAGGIHAEEIGRGAGDAAPGDVAAWLRRQTVLPDAFIDRLTW